MIVKRIYFTFCGQYKESEPQTDKQCSKNKANLIIKQVTLQSLLHKVLPMIAFNNIFPSTDIC